MKSVSLPFFCHRGISAGSLALALFAGATGNMSGATSVGVLNPNAPPPGGVQNSPNNVGNANFITVANMATAVAAAFNNNTGGVIDWEGSNGWIANGQNAVSQTVSYGVAQANTLTVTLATSTFGPTTLNNSPVTTSGTNYLGFQTASPNTLMFSSPLSAWGMTEINRTASRDVTFSFTLLDNTVINYALQNQDPAGNNTGAFNWYGIQVPNANPIVSATFVASGFVRFDDMAFIVAPAVPEPGVATVFGIASLLGMMKLRRKN